MLGIMPTSDSSSPFLPQDVILYILGKADNICLCRCMALNKFWCSSLMQFKFLSHHHLIFSHNKQALLLHICFPEWTKANSTIISVNALTGATKTLCLPTQLTICNDFTLVGSELGNVCLTLTDGCRKNIVLIWNLLMSSVCHLPQPRIFKAHTCVSIFSFTYYPSTMEYCVMHVFKQKFDDKNIWYTFWNSKYQQWEPKRVSNGDTTNVSPDYVSKNGLLFWINFGGLTLDKPQSVLIFSITNYKWCLSRIPNKTKSDCNAPVLLKDQICYISYLANIDYYSISLWILQMKREDSFRWNPLYIVETIRMYEQPKLFLEEELICLTRRKRRIYFYERNCSFKMFLGAISTTTFILAELANANSIKENHSSYARDVSCLVQKFK